MQGFAADLLIRTPVSETQLRRAISAMYYGLFHRLTVEGAAVFGQGGLALTGQVVRAYNHGPTRKLCEDYVRSPKQPFRPPLDHLAPAAPDGRLITVADAFVKLQEARHTADYDLYATIERRQALDLLYLAEHAHRKLDEVVHLPETAVFLAALLLGDRWTRRG